MKRQHWCGFRGIFVREGAPVLEFDYWELLETTKIRHSSEGWDDEISRCSLSISW